MYSVLHVEDKRFLGSQLAASLVDMAVARGTNKEKLLRGTGIFSDDLCSDSALLSAQQLLKLIQRTRQLCRSHDVPFQVGKRIFPGNYRPITDAMLHCQNLAEAIRILHLHRLQICPFVGARSYRVKGKLYLFLYDAIGCGDNWQFVLEIYLSALVAACRFITGKHISFRFHFDYERPRYVQEYEVNLGLKSRFSQPLSWVDIPLSQLTIPALQSSPTLKRLAMRKIADKPYPRSTFIDALQQFIIRHPLTTLEQTAQAFSTSPATLKRRLKNHGVKFQQVCDLVRREQLYYHLCLQHLNNEQAAQCLAINDLPNFRRAVKRWTGLTPSQLRSCELAQET